MEREDYGEVYSRHQRELICFATALVGPTDAADVVSDAVIAVLRSRSLSGIRDPRAYLYRAVLNAARASHRRTARRRSVEHTASRLLSRSGVAAGVAVDAPSYVGHALRMLSDRQRAVVFLVYWEDLTPQAAAVRLGISTGAVKKHLARARSLLREVLPHGAA